MAQAYGVIAGRLYVPVEAWFDPEVSEAELAAQLIADRVYVWHPAAGLFGFEPHEAIGVESLLQMPVQRRMNWDRGRPGVSSGRRLVSIQPAEPPSVEQIFQQVREDIGGESKGLAQLPPSPEEPAGDALSKMRRKAAGAAARFVQWLTRKASGAAAGAAGKQGALARWASQKLAQLTDAMQRERHKEVLRLMRLLQTDPDQGLRYALPLFGGDHRGRGTPSARLPARNTDFSLSRLGGGGPGDPWVLPSDYYARLRQSYYDLANRETQLGRHRRAAYVYAELLGDLNLAASTLMAGGCWREAAALYQQRLHRPDQAALCLEKGGLWSEAVALHQQIGNFERAGDLLTQLDQQDEARRCYREAAERLHAAGDLLAAARIENEKLHDCQSALATLGSGWPESRQAQGCLEQFFDLLGKLGRHDEAARTVQALRKGGLPVRRAVWLTEVLAGAARTYPDEPVRTLVADAVRTVAAGHLALASADERRQILAAVARLVPSDRLLDRDCQRYLRTAAVPPAALPPSVLKPKPQRSQPKLVREFGLPRHVQWQAAAGWNGQCYAVGWVDDGVQLTWGNWENEPRQFWGVQWRRAAGRGDLHVLAPRQTKQWLIVQVLGGDPLLPLTIAAPDRDSHQMGAGTPAWMPKVTLGSARAYDGTTWAVTLDNDLLVAHAFDSAGRPAGSRTVPLADVWPQSAADVSLCPLPVCIARSEVYVGLHDRIMVLRQGGRRTVLHLPRPVLSLENSAAFTRPRVVAGLHMGVALYWEEKGGHLETFAAELERPVVGYPFSGCLVAASARKYHIYRTEDYRIELLHELPGDGAQPVALLPAMHGRQFALLTTEGKVRVYEIP